MAGWITYVAFVLLTGLLYGPHLVGVVTDGSWLAGTFLLGPAIGLASVVAGVIVSARVNDPRTAQQIGGIVIVPLVGIAVVQASGTILFGALGYAITAAVVLLDQRDRPAGRRQPLRPRDDPHPLALGRAATRSKTARLAATTRSERQIRFACRIATMPWAVTSASTSAVRWTNARNDERDNRWVEVEEPRSRSAPNTRVARVHETVSDGGPWATDRLTSAAMSG